MTTLAAWVCIGAPLAGAGLTPLLARVHPRLRDLGAVAFSAAAAAAALSLLPRLAHPEALPVEQTLAWIERPIRIGFGVLVDPLAIVLANVVAVVGFVIMVYCLGYMRGDPARTRFWMWMNGFIGSMLLLVLASDLLFVFVGWKLVGVCSFGLIGYYYQDQRKYWIGGPPPDPFVKPSEAGLKALVVTGLGDMLMLGGLLLVYVHAGTLNFLELYATAPDWLAAMSATPGLVVVVALLLLAGPLGKSAQFPFHEWLPEAMAGPGPVSALIHAATMVKSGVYLVARLVPLFYYGYWVAGIGEAGWFFQLTAWIGAFTAFLAATQGLVAVELKKVLAYSTVSQIGYMMLGLGVAGLAPGLLAGGYTAGVFHLVSHALFKACLFLCAGTVIQAAQSFYLTDMGGVRSALPLTRGFMLVAALALMGVPPLPGFWSKDAVLLATVDASLPLFGLALATAAITAAYTVRFFALVFHGPAGPHRSEAAHGGEPVGDGEPPGRSADGTPSMRWAAGALALGLVAAGLGGPALERLLHHAFAIAGFHEALLLDGPLRLAAVESPGRGLVPTLSVLVVLAGAAPAWLAYGRGTVAPGAVLERSRTARALHRFFRSRWGIDAALARVFVDGTRRIALHVARKWEAELDEAVHRRWPARLTERMQDLVHHLRADTEVLLYNVSYVLILFGLLLAYMFLGAG